MITTAKKTWGPLFAACALSACGNSEATHSNNSNIEPAEGLTQAYHIVCLDAAGNETFNDTVEGRSRENPMRAYGGAVIISSYSSENGYISQRHHRQFGGSCVETPVPRP